LPSDVKKVQNEFANIEGIQRMISTSIGPSAYIAGEDK